MVEGVIETSDQSERGQIRLAQRAKHQRRAEADKNDADILDAVPREQALEVVLHQRVEHSQQSRRHAQRQHHGSHPKRRRSVEIEEDARHAVDAGLEDDARHQRGNIAGRNRVRLRNPDVQRNHPRLHAEAKKKKQKNSALLERRHARSQQMEAGEIQAAAGGGENQKRNQQQASAGVRHDQEKHSSIARLFLFILEADQAVRRQRHDLPGNEEEERIRRGENQRNAQQQQIEKESERAQVSAAFHLF